MKHYELMYLVSGSIPETELEKIQKEISGWIGEHGGKITTHQALGRRHLAYPVNKEQHGYYFVSEFDGEGNIHEELKKRFRLNGSVLRYLLMKKKPLSAKDLLQQEKAKKSAQARMTGESLGKDRRDAGTMRIGKPENATDASREKESPKIKLEELDKKLDELLDQDIVS